MVEGSSWARAFRLGVRTGLLGFVGASVALACGSSGGSSGFGSKASASGDDASGDDDSGTGGEDDASGGGSSGGGGSGFKNTDSGSSIAVIPGTACGASRSKGTQQNLDIYAMIDQSASMAEPGKWTAVTGALTSFLTQTNVAGISIGIQYFGQGAAGASCNAADYAKPAVEIAPLPGVAAAIQGSIPVVPLTVTPTSAALQGAIDHATAWAQAHTKDVTVVLLATDGDPDTCDINIADVAAIAQKAAQGTPKILTYVIGVGPDLTNLDQIATGGGTKSAFLVDSGNKQQFIDAMNAIRGKTLGCQFKIPLATDGGTADPTKVNVEIQTSAGTKSIGNVASKAKCPATGDAWYYDNPSAPTQILLCDTSCTTVEASAATQVNILTGCATVPVVVN